MSDIRLSTHFSLSEFTSHDGIIVPEELRGNLRELVEMLEQIRLYAGVSMHVVSGYRSPAWNKRVGGALSSDHLTAQGADVRSKTLPVKEMHKIVLEMEQAKLLPELGGVGVYQTWLHLGVKKIPNVAPRRWTGIGVGSEPND